MASTGARDHISRVISALVTVQARGSYTLMRKTPKLATSTLQIDEFGAGRDSGDMWSGAAVMKLYSSSQVCRKDQAVQVSEAWTREGEPDVIRV